MQKLLISAILFLCVKGTVLNAQVTGISVQKGQKFKSESTVQINSSAEVMGQSMETTMNNNAVTIFEITGTGQNEISLQATIIKLLANSSSMGQEMSYDSEKKDNSGPMADLLGPKINKAESIVIDEKGIITKRDDTGDNGQLGMMGMNNANSTTTELFIPALIGRELKPGNSFTDTSSLIKEKLSSRDSGTYTITAIENGIASISYSGTQIMSTVMEQMGMEMVSSSNNAVKSEIQMDVKTGLVLLKATVVDITVNVEVSGMTIPATGKTIATVKVTPIE